MKRPTVQSSAPPARAPETPSDEVIPGLRPLLVIVMLGALIALYMLLAQRVPIEESPYADDWPDMRVDLNTADIGELRVLPGIGPSLAESIAEDRAQNGPFTSLDDLQRVHMIGPAITERIEPYVVINKPE